MMKRIFCSIAASLVIATSAMADEGMWLLPLIQKLNAGAIKDLGCRLTPEQIYSVNHSSLKDAIVIFGGGTGSPFFSTDTTASLRAAEVEAEVILMAKNIDAVYSDDPKKNPDAVRYSHLTHAEVLEKDLKVMDATAAAMCRDNHIAIHVFGLAEEGGMMKAICGEEIGTIVE